MFAVGKFAGPHPLEQFEILGYVAVTVRAVPPGGRERSAVLTNLFRAQAVHVGVPAVDQGPRDVVKPVEIVRRMRQSILPVKTEPAHVFFDRVGERLAFLCGVGIVKTQVGAAAAFLGDAEIEHDRFRVPDVQEAIGLRRKSCHQPGRQSVSGEIVVDDLANEIAAR